MSESNPPQDTVAPENPASLAVGMAVRVKPGAVDPDYPDIPLGGWAGTICEVEFDLPGTFYLIEWNQRTLTQIPDVYRKRCQRDGIEIENVWLNGEAIEPDEGTPAPIAQPTAIVTRPLDDNIPEDRIRAALGLTSDDPQPAVDGYFLKIYHDFLVTKLVFPFSVQLDDEKSVEVTGLVNPHAAGHTRELFCAFQEGEQTETIKLTRINLPEDHEYHQLLQDYASWIYLHDYAEPKEKPVAVAFQEVEVAEGPKAEYLPVKIFIPDFSGGRSFQTIVLAFGYGLLYGGLLGALVAATRGAGYGMMLGILLFGMLGLFSSWAQSLVGILADRMQLPSSRMEGGILGAIIGAPVGVIVVTATSCYLGLLGGVFLGGLFGRFIPGIGNGWKGAIVGGILGACVLAIGRHYESGFTSLIHAGAIGGLVGVLVFADLAGAALYLDNRKRLS